MPAVRWETLRQEAQALAASTGQPEAFLAQWEHLLSRYADRTRRHGQGVSPLRIPAYHLAPAVLATVWQGLRLHLENRPDLVFPLADALWARPDLESHLLAARLLGIAPVTPPNEALHRLQDWLSYAPDPAVTQALLRHATLRLAAEAPQAYLRAVADGLALAETTPLALQMLVPLLQNPDFENLPAVLRYLTPLLTPPNKAWHPELTAVLRAMARRWPEEITPYLRNLWQSTPSDNLAWLIRRVLAWLPPAQAASLRDLLR